MNYLTSLRESYAPDPLARVERILWGMAILASVVFAGGIL